MIRGEKDFSKRINMLDSFEKGLKNIQKNTSTFLLSVLEERNETVREAAEASHKSSNDNSDDSDDGHVPLNEGPGVRGSNSVRIANI